nr:hypothetical protein [Tanacetum cinerariifolium]
MADIQKPDKITHKKTNKKIPIECTILDLDDKVDDNEDDGTPLRPIFCLKRRSAIKDFDDKEDCFILDFNPEEEEDSVDLSKANDNIQDSEDLFMVSEKGQVACRDYPHSRHLCVKLPFATTSHESYCKLCYCYVCDVAAPCKKWSGGGGHCHALDTEAWKNIRKDTRKITNP